MKRLIFALLAGSLLLLAGCNNKDAVTYSGLEAGTLASGIFTSDGGTKMTVVGNDGQFDVSTTRRVLIQYKTHPVTDASHIDIDLLGLLDAGILHPDEVASMPDEPDGTPIQVSDAWFGGEYLNTLLSFAGDDASQHAIDATFLADENGITLRLHHDGSKDNASSSKVNSAFISVPIQDLLEAYEAYARSLGLKQANYPMTLTLQWTERTLEGGPLTLYERKGSYAPRTSN